LRNFFGFPEPISAIGHSNDVFDQKQAILNLHSSPEISLMSDILREPHKPQFSSAPNQARKAATVEESLAAAEELKPMVGKVRQIAKERRSDLSVRGKMALPPEQR
jgi:hypothetical protein